MRMARWAGALVGLAVAVQGREWQGHQCIHDFLLKQRQGPLRRMQVDYGPGPRRGEPEQAKESIRINYYWGNVCRGSTGGADRLCYCENADANTVPTFDNSGGFYTCSSLSADNLVSTAKKNYLSQVMADAITYIQATIKVTRVSGVLKASDMIVGGFPDSSQTPFCGRSNWNDRDVQAYPAHHSTGVSGADFLVYLTAAPTTGGTVAWALGCWEDQNGRPTGAHVNFGPDQFDTSVATGTLTYKNYVATAVHEIYHALGFSDHYWGGANNYPQWFQAHCGAEGSGANCRPVATFTENGKTVTKIDTPEVLTKLREYSGCSTLNGAEIEDQGGSGTAGSHWEKRVFGNEAMTGTSYSGWLDLWSTVTLAYFKDTGIYDVDYNQADSTYVWGKSKGCPFWTQKCGDLATSGAQGSYPEFCFPTNPTPSGTYPDECTFNLDSYGPCNVQSASQADVTCPGEIPSYFLSYPSSIVSDNTVNCYAAYSGSSLMDYCPRVSPYSNAYCTNTADLTNYDQDLGASRGANSRCFNSNVRQVSGGGWNVQSTVRCFQVECASDCQSYTVKLARTGATGGFYTLTCTAEGQPTYPSDWTANFAVQSGGGTPTVTCWSPAEMCAGRATLGNTCVTSTSAPTNAPSTSAPTNAPSKSPSTSAPTNAPSTSAPTNNPVTPGSPTRSPTTSAPTPAPSDTPTTSAPTNNPIIPGSPTSPPVTSAPTENPIAPSRSPTSSPSVKPITLQEVNNKLTTVSNLGGLQVQTVETTTTSTGVRAKTTMSGDSASFTPAVQTQFIDDTAQLLGVAASRIVIVSVVDGSVIVEFDVLNEIPTPVPPPPVIGFIPPEGDDGIETWVIIVIVVACVTVLATVVMIVFCCCCKKEEEDAKALSKSQAPAPGSQAPY